MPLTAECMAVLENMQANNVPAIKDLPYNESRALFNEIFKAKPEEQDPVDRIEELSIPVDGGEIPARLYAPNSDEPLPVMVHFHGGGWVIMNLDTHDVYCRLLANKAKCAVIAVEYRKAPEHKAPVAFEDCLAALNWVAANGAALGVDTSRMGVVGDSAGGNLAAAVAIAARDAGEPALKAQVLTYPAVDMTLSSPSIEENKDAPILGRVRWSGSSVTTSVMISIARIRASHRCMPVLTRTCRPLSSLPRNSIRCATKAKPTPRPWKTPALRLSADATTASFTASCCCPR